MKDNYDNDIMNLSDPDIWKNEQFKKSFLSGISNDGYSDELINVVDAMLNMENISCFNDLKKTLLNFASTSLEKLGDEIDDLLNHLEQIIEFNESCYLRDSPEKTRVIQWPNNPSLYKNSPDHYFDIYDDFFYKNTHRFIDKATPIGSAGSCFALRIAHQLQLWGYNYIIEEDDFPEDAPLDKLTQSSYRMSPARVGTLFNAPSMRQMVERAFGEWAPEKNICFHGEKIYDPYRNVRTNYSDLSGYVRDYDAHTQALNIALSKCKVFILTLGLTEAWQFADSGDYISVSPWKIEPSLLRAKHLSVEDNINELERLFSVYKKYCPDIKLIISVSPVPLNKTFSTDSHIVVANMRSKSILRIAAEDFCRNHPNDVFYFPSYEIVTCGTRNAWENDQRHVSKDAVQRVMRLFQKMFLVEQKELSIADVPTPKKVNRNYLWIYTRKILRPMYRYIKKIRGKI